MKYGTTLRILTTAAIVSGLVAIGASAAEAAPTAPSVVSQKHSAPRSAAPIAITSPAALPDGLLLSMTGTGQPGATVTLTLVGYDPVEATATVAADGTWEIPVDLVLTGGTLAIVVQDTAPGTAGNVTTSTSQSIYATR